MPEQRSSKSKKPKSKRKSIFSKKKLLFWGGVALIIYIFIFGHFGYISRHQKERQIHQLKVLIEKTREENTLLEKEIEDLKENPARIEKEARESLGMVLPGEYPVEFIKRQEESSEAIDQTNQKE
ncbi:TPA: hypothetical protein DCX15_05440 [bacterium]|nr:hypothetical protein [bacterium]